MKKKQNRKKKNQNNQQVHTTPPPQNKIGHITEDDYKRKQGLVQAISEKQGQTVRVIPKARGRYKED